MRFCECMCVGAYVNAIWVFMRGYSLCLIVIFL